MRKKKKKTKVLVLMGGPSSEHEVSLVSGSEVLKALPSTYKGIRGAISKDANFEEAVVRLLKRHKPDIVFLALHGGYGEDGIPQALLTAMGVPYTGSGVLASALGMDKPLSAVVFRGVGLRVPDFEVLARPQIQASGAAKRLVRKFRLPLVVKPANHGSSVGVTIVRSVREFPRAARLALKWSERVIVQKFIAGRELTCGVIEKNPGEVTALPPTEIVPRHGAFYDYASKYDKGGSDHLTPPPGLSKKEIAAVQEAAILAHTAIGASGMSRTDFMRAKDGTLYVLEINTIPGMTPTSLLPDAARAAGIAFPRLLDLIVRSALRRTSHTN